MLEIRCPAAVVQGEYELSRAHMAKEAKQAEKLETKLKLLTQGYIVRAEQLVEQVTSRRARCGTVRHSC